MSASLASKTLTYGLSNVSENTLRLVMRTMGSMQFVGTAAVLLMCQVVTFVPLRNLASLIGMMPAALFPIIVEGSQTLVAFPYAVACALRASKMDARQWVAEGLMFFFACLNMAALWGASLRTDLPLWVHLLFLAPPVVSVTCVHLLLDHIRAEKPRITKAMGLPAEHTSTATSAATATYEVDVSYDGDAAYTFDRGPQPHVDVALPPPSESDSQEEGDTPPSPLPPAPSTVDVSRETNGEPHSSVGSCTRPGCKGKHRALGLCGTHYNKLSADERKAWKDSRIWPGRLQ